MSTRLKRPVRVSELAKALPRAFDGEDFDLEAVAPLSAPREGALTFMSRRAALSFPPKVAVLAPDDGMWQSITGGGWGSSSGRAFVSPG